MRKIFTVSLMILFAGMFSLIAEDGEPVERKSPFASPNEKAVKQPPPTASANPLDNFEFNGVLVMGGEVRISVFDKKENRNYWISQGDEIEGLRVSDFVGGSKAGKESVVLRRGSHSKTLELKNSDIEMAPMPVPQTHPADSALAEKAKNEPPKKNKDGSIQTASDEEVRERMKRVAEEIRRRRAARRRLLSDVDDEK